MFCCQPRIVSHFLAPIAVGECALTECDLFANIQISWFDIVIIQSNIGIDCDASLRRGTSGKNIEKRSFT